MKRQSKKALSLFLSLALVLGMFTFAPMTALAAETGYAGGMDIGTFATNPRYITMGEYNGYPLVWRVLEVYTSDGTDGNTDGNKTAFLVSDDVLRTTGGAVEVRSYNNSYNSFPDSGIKAWLNDGTSGFYASLTDYDAGIIDATYGPDNGSYEWYDGSSYPTTGTSKVFLLSAGEANNSNYYTGSTDREGERPWWLRSPGLTYYDAAFVDAYGSVKSHGDIVGRSYAVRPALKINLSSDSFTSVSAGYSVTVMVTDGINPIPGAKVTSAQSAEVCYTNSSGIAVFKNTPLGIDTISVTKAGYAVKQQGITISGVMSETLELTQDAVAMPDKVYFGKYGGNPIEWRVLDVDLVGGKALLFADAALFQHSLFGTDNVWSTSNLRETLNDTTAGFLQTGNFTADEYAVILQTETETGVTDRAFTLSSHEARLYMPDNTMRTAAQPVWLRNASSLARVAYIADSGDIDDVIGSPVSNNSNYVRPAMWVDLTKLCLASDMPNAGDTTLTPLLLATVTVTAGGSPLDGAAITLTPQSPLPPEPRTAAGDALALSGTTSGGAGAAFNLQPGTYSISASKARYVKNTGTLTVSDGGANTAGLTLKAASSGGGDDTTYYTVKFDSQGGSAVGDKSVVSGGTFTEPASPTREGYTFSGWYTDKGCTSKHDFTASVTKALTLYAGWEKNPLPDLFTDDNGHWAEDYINSLGGQGYISGMGNGKYTPDAPLTRAQFVQILYNVWGEGDAASPADPFTDTALGAWYEKALNWAYAGGLISGYSAESFGPNDPLTREQMALLIVRAAGKFEIDLPDGGDKTAFSDDKDIAVWAYEAVYAMQKAGIIGGRPDGSFDPQGTLTRGEMAKVMYYVLELAGMTGDEYKVG